MAALMIVLLFILTVAAAVITSICVEESKAWLTWLINFVIERAVRRLPDASRERYAEEWHSHVSEMPGTIGKLVAALSLLRAARKMSPALAGHSGRIREKDDTTALEQKTRKILARLLPREEEILRMRFGIGQSREHTVEEIAEKFAITPEEVLAIYKDAMWELIRSRGN